LCAEILQAKGYRVKTVTWARDALESAKTVQFDLLLTDLVMPEMDGLQLIWQVREHQRELPQFRDHRCPPPTSVCAALRLVSCARLTASAASGGM